MRLTQGSNSLMGHCLTQLSSAKLIIKSLLIIKRLEYNKAFLLDYNKATIR